MSNETQHTPADMREWVAREVFTLDANWRREYWDHFRRSSPRQAQAYYDTADRILALLRSPRGEVDAGALAALVVHIWTRCKNEGPYYRETDEFWADFECAYQLATFCSNAQGEDRWEDLVFGPIVEAYNEAHAARPTDRSDDNASM